MRIQPGRLRLLIPFRRACLSVAVLSLAVSLFCMCSLFDSGLTLSLNPPAQLSWPHAGSDLSPDPDALFGGLDNGVRFIIKKNKTPRDRVSMHLVVQTGSLYERPNERGMAHFLEHMLFNGSVHFAPGEMVKYFQRIGMQFGPDANAHTGFTHTVYDVVLPRGDAEDLSEGLLVLRDYADGALLLPAEVERERKVVLAEMRSRDSAQFRTFKATLQFEFPGLLIGQRFPIGEAQIIEKMDHRMLREFYKTWYRPERMILVIVGDMEPDLAKELIRNSFGDLEAGGPLRSPPAIGSMKHQGLKTFYHHEKETGATHVAIETVEQQTELSDSMDRRKEEMVAQLINAMIRKRLDAMLQHPETAITSADVDSGQFLRQIKYAQIEADCKPEAWQQALAEIEQALRKALIYGFSATELQSAKMDSSAQLLKAVQEEGTRDSKELAREIMVAIEDWKVFQSPRQRADMLIPWVGTITLEQIQNSLAQTWSADQRLILVSGNADLSSSAGSLIPEERIKAAYLASQSLKLDPPADKKPAVFPYLPLPASVGVIVRRSRAEDLGIEQVEFSNGFRLNLKNTRFKENQVLAALSFGYGDSSEPKNLPGLSKMTQAVVDESGFGAMNRIELEMALSGRLVQTHFDIEEDKFIIKGQSASAEIPVLFELLRTFVQDPGFREDARRLVLKRFQQEYESLPHSSEGLMYLKGERFLAGGDSRFGAPAWDQLQQLTLNQMKTWMKAQMHPKAMELAIVGDFDTEKATQLAARYFGSMENLESNHDQDMTAAAQGPVFPRGQSLALSVDTDIPKTLVVVAFSTEDFWDIRRTRRLTIMAGLISERLREHIREKLGAAYSPYAFNHSYRAYEGYGLTQIHVQADPEQAGNIVEEIRHIAEDLAAQKADPDEFKRVLDPTLTHLKDLRQTNTYWLNSVLTGLGRYPQQLDWSRTLEKDYAAISAEEIAALARRYLVPDNTAVIVLSPDKTGGR